MFMTIIAYSNNITQYGTDMCVPGIAPTSTKFISESQMSWRSKNRGTPIRHANTTRILMLRTANSSINALI